MKRILVAALSLALIICMVSGMTGCGFAKKGEDLTTSPVSERTHAETPENTTAQETVTETQIVTETETSSVTTTRNLTTTQASLWQKAQMAYLMEIQRVEMQNEGGRNTETTRFILYDFDNNGIPELIIDHGYKTNTYEEGYAVYKYTENGLINLGSVFRHADCFYDTTPGDGEFNVIMAYHYGVGEYRYKIQGDKLIETVVTEMHMDGEEQKETDELLKRAEPYKLFDWEDWTDSSQAASYFANL